MDFFYPIVTFIFCQTIGRSKSLGIDKNYDRIEKNPSIFTVYRQNLKSETSKIF
jgi:hypothetical protein